MSSRLQLCQVCSSLRLISAFLTTPFRSVSASSPDAFYPRRPNPAWRRPFATFGPRSRATVRDATAALICEVEPGLAVRSNRTTPPPTSVTPRNGGPDSNRILTAVISACKPVISADAVTPEATLVALQACLRAAKVLHPPTRPRTAPSHDAALRTRDAISAAALAVLEHPPVVITPEALAVYADIQTELGTASSLPDVLSLYATKPRPGRRGRLQYPNPNRAEAAIETATASRALAAAIAARDLDAALGITKICYATPAYRRQYLLRYGLGPAAAVLAAPAFAYGLASAIAHVQVVVEPSTATVVAFLGIMTYMTVTGFLGVLSRVTADDHMRRVSWVPGTSLWHRWLGEAERAALDRVACAWGFRDQVRHGEETGPEWETLREYTLLRHMILDRVEFMEGMQ